MKNTLKKILSVFLAFVLSFGVLNLAFADETEQVPEGYIGIYTAEDLNNIRNNLSGKYFLMNDIDLSVYENWEPIGTDNLPFTGEFNGNGNEIINFLSEYGLFYCVSKAKIKNVGITHCNINGIIKRTYIGVIANKSINSNFENCYTSGKVFKTTGNGQLTIAYDLSVGGLAGLSSSSSFKNCYSTVSFSLDYTVMNRYAAGGLIGEADSSEFSCCYAVSTFSEVFIGNGNTEGRNIYTGGLIGNSVSNNVFSNCYYSPNSINSTGLPDKQQQGTEGISIGELSNKDSYEGFDFEKVWVIEENGYPVLNYEKINSNLDDPEPTLINAKIIKVPFEKRIVWSNSPDSPNGIEIQLEYSDSTFIIDTIVENEYGYFANSEQIITPEKGAENDYGILSTGLYLNNGEIYVSYKYLALPTISDFFNMVLGTIRTGGASM